jgi:hypothetical protein
MTFILNNRKNVNAATASADAKAQCLREGGTSREAEEAYSREWDRWMVEADEIASARVAKTRHDMECASFYGDGRLYA